MSYSPHNIRNVCLLGHGGNGKTTLVESFLYMTGARDRLGRTTDGNTICDYDPEEVKRQISISAAVAPIEYNGCKINVLDTPGNFDFAGEVVVKYLLVFYFFLFLLHMGQCNMNKNYCIHT